MFSKTLIILAAVAQAFAAVTITAPVASTVWSGGKEATITWIDSGAAPSLKDFGPARVSIYAGNAIQQTSLQTIGASIDVSQVASVTFTPDPTIGPNSSDYFIRIESLSLKDAEQPQYPALAFSAKFTLNSMTGAFTAEVLAQIAGQSTAPLPGGAPASTSASRSASSTAASTSGSATPTRSGSAASQSSAPASGALSTKAGWAGVVIGALAGVALF